MAILINGTNAQSITVRNGWKAKDVVNWLEENGELPSHTRPLTVKADGRALGSGQVLPKDVGVLEIVELHDPEVVKDNDSDETMPVPELPTDSGSTKG